jgi:hypothetical protein
VVGRLDSLEEVHAVAAEGVEGGGALRAPLPGCAQDCAGAGKLALRAGTGELVTTDRPHALRSTRMAGQHSPPPTWMASWCLRRPCDAPRTPHSVGKPERNRLYLRGASSIGMSHQANLGVARDSLHGM